jgi:thioredoxin 1
MLIHITNENFKKEVLSSSKPIIVDFFAEWCMPCKMMAPVFEGLSNKIKNLTFAKLNTEEYPELASGLGIQGIPCLIIFSKGKEVGRIVGFMQEPELKNKIESILKQI